MASIDDLRVTDVPGSIAGFYLQIVVACNEICKEDVSEVGVETGADIVVINKKHEKKYIETKLHTAKFHKYSEDVIKTLYNFYNSYRQKEKIIKMEFMTNVGIKEETLFNSWGTDNANEIRYIKEALLRKSIDAHSQCKENFEGYYNNKVEERKKQGHSEDEKLEKKEFLIELIKEVFSEKENKSYSLYAIENSELEYNKFRDILNFKYANKKKCELIKSIEDETINKIKKDYIEIPINVHNEKLADTFAEYIFNCLVNKVFDTISENSQNRTKINVPVNYYFDCLSECYKNRVIPKDISNMKLCLEALAFDEEDFMENLILDNADDYRYLNCYLTVKNLFIEKLLHEKKFDFIHSYFLKESMNNNINEICNLIIALIDMLSVIMYEEKISVNDVKLFLNDRIDNMEILTKLKCCYKKTYRKNKIDSIIRDLATRYSTETITNDKQIIVADGEYYTGGKPCDFHELQPEVYDFTQVDQNFKDYMLFKNLNYKCTSCLERNGDNCNFFWEGGGGLCKKIL
jgi:hypothetical protein